MENKLTAMQKLSFIVESMISKSLLYPQDRADIVGYQAAAVEIKKYIGGLLLMEKEQIIDAKNDPTLKSPEQYYNETYGSQAPQRLEQANGKDISNK